MEEVQVDLTGCGAGVINAGTTPRSPVMFGASEEQQISLWIATPGTYEILNVSITGAEAEKFKVQKHNCEGEIIVVGQNGCTVWVKSINVNAANNATLQIIWKRPGELIETSRIGLRGT